MSPFSIQPLPISPTVQTVINDGVLWAVFMGAIAIFLVFTWILVYHWRKFDFSFTAFTFQAKVTYFVGSAVIIIAMLISLTQYLYG